MRDITNLIQNIASKVIEEMEKNDLTLGDIDWVLSSVKQKVLESTHVKTSS